MSKHSILVVSFVLAIVILGVFFFNWHDRITTARNWNAFVRKQNVFMERPGVPPLKLCREAERYFEGGSTLRAQELYDLAVERVQHANPRDHRLALLVYCKAAMGTAADKTRPDREARVAELVSLIVEIAPWHEGVIRTHYRSRA